MTRRAWFSVRTRKRSPRYDAAALAIVVMLTALALAGVYLLALAAAIFVTWLLRIATRRSPEHIAETPGSQAGPGTPAVGPYRSVLQVDPSVFADVGAAKATAKRAFESWVRGLPCAPKQSVDLVRSVEIRTRYVGHVATELEGRQVVERCEPAAGREPVSAAPYARQSIDPWNPPHDLPRASRFIAACWSCSATGRVECASCHGTARRPCSGCDGSGKYYGHAANGARRMLNCKTCRGKGDVTCAACTRGMADCATCQRAKKLACWLEVRSQLRQDVQLVPDEPAARALSWGQRGVRASADQLARDARIVERVGKPRALTLEDLSTAVPAEWRAQHGPSLQTRVEPGERVRAQTFTFFAVPSACVSYSVLGEQHVVVLEGLQMLAPPATEPFLRRARMLGRVKLSLAALPAAAAAIYASRGAYFTSGRAAGLVAGVVIAAAITAVLAYTVLWNATIGRRARTWALTAIVPVALATTMAVLAEPRIARAHDLVAAGQLDAAAAELRAMDIAPGDEAWADLHLRRSRAATTCAESTAQLQDIASGLAQRAEAQAHADELALAEAQAAVRVHNTGGASTALACGSDAWRATAAARTIRAEIADLDARRCMATKDWACALDRASSGSEPARLRADILAVIRIDADAHAAAAARGQGLEQRVQDEQSALALWRTYLLDAGSPVAPPKPVIELRAALARDQPALAAQQRIAQARAEAEARRQAVAAERERKQAELSAERERKQAERAAERERRREAAAEERANRSSDGLLCNDGTLSPSCTCSGSHRGCCSWHGGVAGCQ